jgi:pSer/pThr/pTyr-binding forkhead associated (FHA) protein
VYERGAGSSKVVHTLPPMDGTLQFLPGRLEIVDGDSPGRDIRFVRTWGEVPEITFGRVTGPPYRHVQLRSQTVSRQHARMQYTDGRWQLTNLSQTNPVVINGQALDTAHGQRVLREGDQIEMGEVVFRFRER